MDIDQLKRIIKNNLVSYGLLVYQIEAITEQMASDIMELLENESD